MSDMLVRDVCVDRINPMSANPSTTEAKYWSLIDALCPKERVARAAAMFQWSREMFARQFIRERTAEGTTISDEELKWHVALRMYGSEPAVATMIRQRLEDVSR